MGIKTFITFGVCWKLHSKNFYIAIKNKFLQEDIGCVSKSKMILLNIDLGSIQINFKKKSSCLCRNTY